VRPDDLPAELRRLVARDDLSIHEDTMSNVTRSTPYVAPGAPTSPLILAVAGLLVAAASALAARLGFELTADGTAVATVAGVLAGLLGLLQHRLARREQQVGAPLLRATVTAPPVDPEQVGEALGRLRAMALTYMAPEQPRPVPAPDRWSTAAEQLHLLDPEAPPGLDRWSGKALRRILAGEHRGAEGPISWRVLGDDAQRLQVAIDGTVRMAVLEDEQSVARALGAELWLAAAKNASADAPLPRPRVPSGALLDSDGEPVSAGDLDEDPDPDQRSSAED
jgi:hypothetical protein